MEEMAVERSIWIDAPPERVWRAITTADQLDRWYADDYRWDIPALEAGAGVKFYNKDDHEDVQIATIEVVDPPREFTVRWQPDREFPQVTLVTSFLLQGENGGTRATIRESGYELFPDNVRQKWLEAAGGGYTMSLENLKALVEGSSPAQETAGGQPEVEASTRQEMAVERSIWIDAPRERVWRAVTEADQIRQWWGGDYWEITALQVGETVKFGDPGDLMLATIAVVDPPREFSLQWPPQPQYHSIPVFTTFRLEEENGGTRLTVTETGFEALPEEIRQERYDSTAQGYETVLAELKVYVEGNTNP